MTARPSFRAQVSTLHTCLPGVTSAARRESPSRRCHYYSRRPRLRLCGASPSTVSCAVRRPYPPLSLLRTKLSSPEDRRSTSSLHLAPHRPAACPLRQRQPLCPRPGPSPMARGWSCGCRAWRLRTSLPACGCSRRGCCSTPGRCGGSTRRAAAFRRAARFCRGSATSRMSGPKVRAAGGGGGGLHAGESMLLAGDVDLAGPAGASVPKLWVARHGRGWVWGWSPLPPTCLQPHSSCRVTGAEEQAGHALPVGYAPTPPPAAAGAAAGKDDLAPAGADAYHHANVLATAAAASGLVRGSSSSAAMAPAPPLQHQDGVEGRGGAIALSMPDLWAARKQQQQHQHKGGENGTAAKAANGCSGDGGSGGSSPSGGGGGGSSSPASTSWPASPVAAAATAAGGGGAMVPRSGGASFVGPVDPMVVRRCTSTMKRVSLEWRNLGCCYSTAKGPKAVLEVRACAGGGGRGRGVRGEGREGVGTGGGGAQMHGGTLASGRKWVKDGEGVLECGDGQRGWSKGLFGHKRGVQPRPAGSWQCSARR